MFDGFPELSSGKKGEVCEMSHIKRSRDDQTSVKLHDMTPGKIFPFFTTQQKNKTTHDSHFDLIALSLFLE